MQTDTDLLAHMLVEPIAGSTAGAATHVPCAMALSLASAEMLLGAGPDEDKEDEDLDEDLDDDWDDDDWDDDEDLDDDDLDDDEDPDEDE